ncbi:hypothetical protein ACQUQU_17860 [Thalassolituus sp. LLYu03]|uniref:hypothetical protein n=1 Tax=Thalassolituus sp. LLYu03 TaxID=3421656 RepID=UPI003D290920
MHDAIKGLAAMALLAGSLAVQAESGRSDYDLDDDGLIEINDLDDLVALRRAPSGANLYGSSAGCPESGCIGFELTTDLDFDTDKDGLMTASDDYFNGGSGWFAGVTFTAVLDGNGHLIRNLYAPFSRLFSTTDGATIRNLGLDGPAMQTQRAALASEMDDTNLSKVFSTGAVAYTSQRSGGLIGESFGNSSITDSFTTGSVTATNRAGGLVGQAASITITNSFAIGEIVSAGNLIGGIAGELNGDPVVTNTYWATDATGLSGSHKSNAATGYLGATLAELQCPTAAGDTACVTGTTLYGGWSTDTWDFGTASQMPGLMMNGTVYRDTDGDGAVDSYDAFPFNAAASVDNDGDGLPTNFNPGCDSECQASSGLTLDDDNDNDGVINEEDDLPQNAAASVDTDGDGQPDYFNDDCDSACQEASGLTLDDDLDGDGVANADDPDNTADNGAPVIECVPDTYDVRANSDDGAHLLVSVSELDDYQGEFCLEDAIDDYADITLQPSINGVPLTLDDDEFYELPTGAVHIQWIATDTAGNHSEPATSVINVYPQLRFSQADSITGEPSSARILVSLTGVSPEYPVNIEYSVDTENSTVTQDDIDASFDITATHTVAINAGDEGNNTEAVISIPVLADSSSEEDEVLILSISGAVVEAGAANYYRVNDAASHTLTITEANIAPEVLVDIVQAGETTARVQPDGGDVTLVAAITDLNGNDTHTLLWNLDSLNVSGIEDNTSITFSPAGLEEGEYSVSVTVTDSGSPALSTTTELTLLVAAAEEEPSPGSGGDSGGDTGGNSDGGSGGNSGGNSGGSDNGSGIDNGSDSGGAGTSSGRRSGGGAFFYFLLLTPLFLIRQRRAQQ